MSDKLSIYNTGIEAMNALAPYYQEEAVGKIGEAEARESWFALLNAAAVDPTPLTAARFTAVSPYTSPARINGALGSALENGFLTGSEESGFLLTDKGHAVLAAFFDTAQALIAGAPVLADAEMANLAAYLHRLVAATKDLPDPADKPNLQNSLWTDPGPDAPATVLVDQYITDLRQFRDDAHITAWQKLGVDGRSWETLTFLWNDDAHTAAELQEKLEGRRFTESDYGASLAALVEKGWATQAGDEWQITEAGRTVRQEGEEETDRIYFAGWNTLDETELNDLDDLLQRLLDQLKEAAPAAETV